MNFGNERAGGEMKTSYIIPTIAVNCQRGFPDPAASGWFGARLFSSHDSRKHLRSKQRAADQVFSDLNLGRIDGIRFRVDGQDFLSIQPADDSGSGGPQVRLEGVGPARDN